MLLPTHEYRKFLDTMPIVCVDCLAVNGAGEYLLVKGNNEPLKGEFWLPGGRVLKNERLVDAVHRKMSEELGIEVEVVRNCGFFEEFFAIGPNNTRGGVHSISFVFLVKPKSSKIRLDGQSSEWGWFRHLPTRLTGHPDVRI
jgi:GDP-mannose mannosyl hydrolase